MMPEPACDATFVMTAARVQRDRTPVSIRCMLHMVPLGFCNTYFDQVLSI